MGNREYVGWIVGDNLREVRKSKKMTIEDMCEKTGLSESHLRKIESGTRQITTTVLYKLMNALDEDANTILSVEVSVTEYDDTNSIEETNDFDSESIDKAMSTLPAEQRVYLMGVFKYMIANMQGAA